MSAHPPTPPRLLSVAGDSLTAAGVWPARVAERLNLEVVSTAVAGQTSTEIAIRRGAIPVLLSVPGGAIPEEGACEVVPLTPASTYRADLPPGAMEDIRARGALSGATSTDTIAGVLSHPISSPALSGWSFSRDAPGGSVLVGAQAQFLASPPPFDPRMIHVFWSGRNNPGNVVLRDTAAMVAQVSAAQPDAKILVLGITNSADEPSDSLGYRLLIDTNEALSAAYSERFLDVRQHIITRARQAADISPGDADDLAMDIPPRSLRVDAVHFTDKAYRLIGDVITDRIIELGWAR